ncbi:ATP synthase F0 subunit C [Tautonia sociabilis]|uniref:ATP synthase subunit c n=1 Tax=Tautonia sociabilis TaxID=2080755 RepID=A0A432MRB3_9BACT|nr:ATP synthase F0 subunit C [Tautonia sociabilis]RUL89516.1 ATP synthase F0 subunit C [Tautonia sociabilis]
MSLAKIAAPALVLAAVLLIPAASAIAQDYTPQNADEAARIASAAATKGALSDTRALGAGLVIIGAGVGIGWLTRSAVESMARQPELAGNVQRAMIISAALIEGVTFFALIIIGFILTTY